MAQIFDDVVKVAEVLVGGFARFGAREGYSSHNVGSAFGKVEEDAQESEVRVCVHWCRCRVGVLGLWCIWMVWGASSWA